MGKFIHARRLVFWAMLGATGSVAGQGDPQPVPLPSPGPIPEHALSTISPQPPKEMAPRGPVARLGVAVRVLTLEESKRFQLKDEFGLMVSFVVPESPADRGGLRFGQVLTQFNDQLLILPQQLRVLVGSSSIGSEILLMARDPEKAEPQPIAVILDAAPPVRPPRPDLLAESFRITDRVVRLTSGNPQSPTLIALSTRESKAHLEISEGSDVQFTGPVAQLSEIPPTARLRIQQVADLEDGRWVFKLPLQPPVKLGPDEGPHAPAPQDD